MHTSLPPTVPDNTANSAPNNGDSTGYGHTHTGSLLHSPSVTPEELAEARRVATLISGFITDTLNDKQTEALENWLSLNSENLVLFKQLTHEKNIDWAMNWLRELNVEAAMDKVQLRLHRYRLRRRLISVGLIGLTVLLLSLAFLLLRHQGPGFPR